jgi:hypothetical protein
MTHRICVFLQILLILTLATVAYNIIGFLFTKQ